MILIYADIICYYRYIRFYHKSVFTYLNVFFILFVWVCFQRFCLLILSCSYVEFQIQFKLEKFSLFLEWYQKLIVDDTVY